MEYRRHSLFKRHIGWILFVLGMTMAFFYHIGLASNNSYDPGERRDPFDPLISADGRVLIGTKSARVVVQGIIFDPTDESLVLIDDNLYREGDSIGNANVIKIFKDRVIMVENDEEKELWIREEILRAE